MRSWQSRLLAGAAVGLLGVAVVLAGDLYRSGRQEVLGQFQSMQTLLAQQAVRALTTRLWECGQDLQTLAAQASAAQLDPREMPARIQAYYQTSKHTPPWSLLMVDEHGALVYSNNPCSSAANYADCDFFQWASRKDPQAKVFVSSSLRIDQAKLDVRRNGLITLSTPLYRRPPGSAAAVPAKEWAGVLCAIVDLAPGLREDLSLWTSNKSHRVWIMDREGTILLQSEHPQMAHENIHRTNLQCFQCHASFDYADQMLKARKAGVTEYQLKGQSRKLASFAPLRFANAAWVLVVNAPYHSVTEFTRRNFLKMLLLLGTLVGSLGLAAGLVYQSNLSKARAEEAAEQWQEKHRLEEEIRRTEERYRTLFEQSPEGVVMIDPQTTLPIEFNEAAHRQLGYSREEFARLRLSDYTASEKGEWIPARFAKFMQEGQVRFEAEHRTRDGGIRHIEVIAQPLKLAQQTVFHCIHRDITERKRAAEAMERRAEQMAALYQVSLGIAAETEPGVLFETITKAAVSFFRGEAGGLFIHRPERDALELVTRLGGDGSLEGAWVKLGEDLAGQVWQTDAPLVVHDYPCWEGRGALLNRPPHRAAMAAPIRWADTFLGVLSICSDKPGFFSAADASLLGLFAAQAAIAIKNASLLEQVRQDAGIKTTLLHDVNHRVKNNLLRLIGIVRLEREHAPASAVGLHAALTDLENRMNGMEAVHAMLSRAHWNPLPLKELAAQIVAAALNGSPIRRRIQVSVVAPPEPLWAVPELATAIALILNELTTNSVKYAFQSRQEGRIEVRLEVAEIDQGRPRISLAYRDDGPGWPEPVLRGEDHAVGLYLIQASVRSPLRGKLSLRNDQGAVAELSFKLALAES